MLLMSGRTGYCMSQFQTVKLVRDTPLEPSRMVLFMAFCLAETKCPCNMDLVGTMSQEHLYLDLQKKYINWTERKSSFLKTFTSEKSWGRQEFQVRKRIIRALHLHSPTKDKNPPDNLAQRI